MMAAERWWLPSLPAWLGSEAVWFVALNAVVAAVAILSARARPSQSTSMPRRGAAGVTRRASSAVLQSLRSFSIFSFPSFLQPDAAAFAANQGTEELVQRSPAEPSPRALAVTPPPQAPAADEENEDEDEEDPNAMSMDEAYALVLASRRRPEREQEQQEEARRSDVDAKAEEFIRGFNEDLRQQRLNSIFNYTQMLKQRKLAAGRRQPDQL